MYAFVVAYGLYIKKEDSRPPFFMCLPGAMGLGAGVRDVWAQAALSEGPFIAIITATALLRRIAQSPR